MQPRLLGEGDVERVLADHGGRGGERVDAEVP
jgi:hypothetical protein